MNHPQTLSPEQCQQRMRAAMPVADRVAYFDHAAVAPLSAPAQQRLQQYAEQCARQGDLRWPEWSDEIEASRQVAAAMLHADPGEIAWVANTTQGIGLVAEGLDWREGDNVVTLANEFPSNLYPWMNLEPRGVTVRAVAPADGGRWTAEQLLSACDERTRLISVSWVSYATGFRGPLEALVEAAHRRGVPVFLDAIQGLGVFPLDVRQTPVDFLAADGHKWMLGPEGAGLLYVASSALSMLRPLNVGWNSVRNRYDFRHVELQLREDATRYEGGSHNMPGLLALGASLRLLRDCGHGPRESAVGRAVLAAADELRQRVESLGAVVHSIHDSEHGSGIVSFELPGRDPVQLRARCLAEQVAVSCRNGRLRASPHAYMNEDDLRRLCTVLKMRD